MRVGVLALQGDFREHLLALEECGVAASIIRRPSELVAVDALVLPGGESTAIANLARSFEMFEPLKARISAGMPVYGSCAGMILLADRILDAGVGQETFGGLDITVRRNAFGRQVDSFEATINSSVGDFHGVFIRAPRIERVGDQVEVLGSINDEPVLVRQGNVLAASFHPELSNDARLHEYFVSITANKKKV